MIRSFVRVVGHKMTFKKASVPSRPASRSPLNEQTAVRRLSRMSLAWSKRNTAIWTLPVLASFLALVLGAWWQSSSFPITPRVGHESCLSQDQPNPIYSQFPNNATGALNTTLAIIPIPLETARRIIPAAYGILEDAYRALLPDFPSGKYPVLMQAGHDHDVRFMDIVIDDFSVSKLLSLHIIIQ
jgi:hypothetical protein